MCHSSLLDLLLNETLLVGHLILHCDPEVFFFFCLFVFFLSHLDPVSLHQLFLTTLLEISWTREKPEMEKIFKETRFWHKKTNMATNTYALVGTSLNECLPFINRDRTEVPMEKYAHTNPQNGSPNRWSGSYESSAWPALLHMSLAASDPYVVGFASGCTLSVCLLPVNTDSGAH